MAVTFQKESFARELLQSLGSHSIYFYRLQFDSQSHSTVDRFYFAAITRELSHILCSLRGILTEVSSSSGQDLPLPTVDWSSEWTTDLSEVKSMGRYYRSVC